VSGSAAGGDVGPAAAVALATVPVELAAMSAGTLAQADSSIASAMVAAARSRTGTASVI
jgi:hypothetical protein